MKKLFGFVWAICVALSIVIFFIFIISNPSPVSLYQPFPDSTNEHPQVLRNFNKLFQVDVKYGINYEKLADNWLNKNHSSRVGLLDANGRESDKTGLLYSNTGKSLQHENYGSSSKEDKLESEQNPGHLNAFDKYFFAMKGTQISSSVALEQYYMNVKFNKEIPLRQVVNPHPFSYITNSPNVCERDQGQNVFLMALVPSSVENHNRRNLIRKTWGRSTYYGVTIKVVFLLGKPEMDTDSFLQDAVFEEQALYKDLVQEDFADTYTNLTYKTISGLKWITNHCSKARYVLKIDDHVFVSMLNLLNELLSLPPHPSYIMGNVRFDDVVHRTGRWSIDHEEWGLAVYPVFCVGPAYVLSTDLAVRLYHVSSHVPFFRLEDVYTTGFLPLLVPEAPPRYIQWDWRYEVNEFNFITSFTGLNRKHYLFAHVEFTDMYPSVWSKILQRDFKEHLEYVESHLGPGDRRLLNDKVNRNLSEVLETSKRHDDVWNSFDSENLFDANVESRNGQVDDIDTRGRFYGRSSNGRYMGDAAKSNGIVEHDSPPEKSKDYLGEDQNQLFSDRIDAILKAAVFLHGVNSKKENSHQGSGLTKKFNGTLKEKFLTSDVHKSAVYNLIRGSGRSALFNRSLMSGDNLTVPLSPKTINVVNNASLADRQGESHVKYKLSLADRQGEGHIKPNLSLAGRQSQGSSQSRGSRRTNPVDPYNSKTRVTAGNSQLEQRPVKTNLELSAKNVVSDKENLFDVAKESQMQLSGGNLVKGNHSKLDSDLDKGDHSKDGSFYKNSFAVRSSDHPHKQHSSKPTNISKKTQTVKNRTLSGFHNETFPSSTQLKSVARIDTNSSSKERSRKNITYKGSQRTSNFTNHDRTVNGADAPVNTLSHNELNKLHLDVDSADLRTVVRNASSLVDNAQSTQTKSNRSSNIKVNHKRRRPSTPEPVT